MVRIGCIGLLLGLACNSVHAVDMVWQQDWIHPAPPMIGAGYSYPELAYPTSIRFAGNADLLFASLTLLGEEHDVLRLSPVGAVRWTAKISAYEPEYAPALWPSADGGAFFAHRDSSRTVKLDADGLIEWTRSFAAEQFVDLPGNRVAALSCDQVSVLDAGSGDVAWQLRLPGRERYCRVNGSASDAAGNILLSTESEGIYATTGSRLYRLDDQGRLLWEYQPGSGRPRLLGFDSVHAYLAGESTVLALDIANGAEVWQSAVAHEDALLVPGDPAVPVAIDGNMVHALEAGSGKLLWSRPLGNVDVIAAIGNALMVNSPSGLHKLDALTGAVQWTTNLPSSDAQGHPVLEWLALGGLDDGQFTALARVAGTVSQPAPLLQRIDFASGALTTQPAMPVLGQADYGDAIHVGDEMISMTVEQDPLAMRYRLSKLNADDGTQIWSHTELPTMTGLVGGSFGASFSLGANSERIAAVIHEGSEVEDSLLVGAWNIADGTSFWRTKLNGLENWDQTQASAPVIDADNNVWVSLATYVECTWPDICARYMLYKLDGTNGSILWQNGDLLVTQFEPPHLSIPLFKLVEDDVLLEKFPGLLRLNGLDGSIEWAADTTETSGISSLHIASDGDIVLTGFLGWGRLDAADGTAIWFSNAPAYACAPFNPCRYVQTHEMPNGDLLQVGIRAAANYNNEPMVALLHPENGGSFEVWFPVSSTPLISSVQYVAVDSQSRIWMQIREDLGGSNLRLRYLTRFDPETGTWMGRQAVSNFSYNWLSPYRSINQWLGPPQDGRLPVQVYERASPQLGYYAIGMLDTQVSARGNISITATMDRGPVMPGEEVAFQVKVNYIGTAALDSVVVRIALPWSSGTSDLDCFSGTPGHLCSIEQNDGDLRGTFAMQPGGEIVVSGKVKALDSDSELQRLNAIVQGPVTLMEQESSDNTITLSVTQSLFRNGFD